MHVEFVCLLGFLQGVRRSFLRIGTILGTLWGGSLFRHLYTLLGVLIGLIVMVEVRSYIIVYMCITSYIFDCKSTKILWHSRVNSEG